LKSTKPAFKCTKRFFNPQYQFSHVVAGLPVLGPHAYVSMFS
jgi:hypothetical protein